MGFRRFLLRGQVKVQTELLLLAMAFNINKLHNKIQSGRCGAYLHYPKSAWAFKKRVAHRGKHFPYFVVHKNRSKMAK